MLNYAPTANAYLTYKQTAVETATPEKLLIMLFNGGIKFLLQAEQAIAQKNYALAHTHLTRVQDIIYELMTSLDMEKGGEISSNLYKLYEFYLEETTQANVTKDANRIKPVLEFFYLFKDTWTEAAKQISLGVK